MSEQMHPSGLGEYTNEELLAEIKERLKDE